MFCLGGGADLLLTIKQCLITQYKTIINNMQITSNFLLFSLMTGGWPGLGLYIILKVQSLQAAVTILVKFRRSENLGLVFIFDPT